MTIEPGEIVGIIGYSGAGKSTLVRMINGLDTPSAGELLLDETNIVGMSEKKLRGIRRNIGMIFQQFNLMNSRTAAGNIEYPLQLQGVGKQERAQRVQELLDFVGGRQGQELPGAALRRPEAARWHCPCAGHQPFAAACRRSHFRPRPHHHAGSPRPTAPSEQGIRHHHRRYYPRDGSRTLHRR